MLYGETPARCPCCQSAAHHGLIEEFIYIALYFLGVLRPIDIFITSHSSCLLFIPEQRFVNLYLCIHVGSDATDRVSQTVYSLRCTCTATRTSNKLPSLSTAGWSQCVQNPEKSLKMNTASAHSVHIDIKSHCFELASASTYSCCTRGMYRPISSVQANANPSEEIPPVSFLCILSRSFLPTNNVWHGHLRLHVRLY